MNDAGIRKAVSDERLGERVTYRDGRPNDMLEIRTNDPISARK